MEREIKFMVFDDVSQKIIYWKELTCIKNNLKLSDLRNGTNLKWLQYTGHKVNRIELYEGNIVTTVYGNGFVEFYMDSWYINLGEGRKVTIFNAKEIIGNIYKNPELI